MFTKDFWKKTVERAVKGFAQTAVAVAVAAGPFDAFHVDWKSVLGVSLGAAVLSVLTSLGSIDFGPENDPSVVR
jgi:hypothetical protein